MRSYLKFWCILIPVFFCAAAVAEDTEIELEVVGQMIFPQYPGTVISKIEFHQDGVLEQYLYMGIEANFVKFYAFQDSGEAIDTLDVPQTWVKATNLMIGDSWWGSHNGDSAYFEVVGQGFRTVGAGTFFAKELEVTPLGAPQSTGTEWWSEGVGLLEWFYVEGTNGLDSLNLQEKDIVGGYGTFPLAIGNYWRFYEYWQDASFVAPIADITVDGYMIDWVGLEPARYDPEGDDPSSYSGTDIRQVFVALDPSGNTLYLMAFFWDGSPDPLCGETYGYQFHIHYSSPQADESVTARYGASQWYLEGHNTNVSGATLGVGAVIEIAIPMSNLNFPSELYGYCLQIGQGPDSLDVSDWVEVYLPVTPVKNPDIIPVPQQISLNQNYPNPFNAETTIRYELPSPQNVKLEVFDIAGCKVTTLLSGLQSAGVHQARFNGEALSSGVYIYRLESGSETYFGKMALLK